MKLNTIKIKNYKNIENDIINNEDIFNSIMIGLGFYFKVSTLIKGINKNFMKSDINSEIEVDAFVSNKNISWIRKSNSNTKKYTCDLFTYVNDLTNTRYSADNTGINSILPMFAFYDLIDIDFNFNKVVKKQERSSKIELEYKNAFSGKVDFTNSYDWIYCYNNYLKYGFEFEETRDVLYDCLYKAIPNLKNIEIDYINSDFKLLFDDEYVSYNDLNDNYKIIINIISDICYRCILLNGFLKYDSISKTPGIVMINNYIDDLNILKELFPNIQFIVKY